MSAKNPTLLTLKQFAAKHAHLWTIPSLRWLRFNDQINGFNGAFVKVGRRLLIDETRFFAAIEQLNSPPVARASGTGDRREGCGRPSRIGSR